MRAVPIGFQHRGARVDSCSASICKILDAVIVTFQLWLLLRCSQEKKKKTINVLSIRATAFEALHRWRRHASTLELCFNASLFVHKSVHVMEGSLVIYSDAIGTTTPHWLCLCLTASQLETLPISSLAECTLSSLTANSYLLQSNFLIFTVEELWVPNMISLPEMRRNFSHFTLHVHFVVYCM